MIVRKYFLGSLLYLTSSFIAYGQGQFDEDMDEFGDFYSDAEFISIATGTKKQLNQAPSVATVITAEQIKSIGANNIHQIIETVTGIHVYPSNINRMNPSYSIRGLHSSQNPQVLVLVNGNRTRSNWTGAKWDLFDTGVDIVERIEIIKGPGSAVHGADAFSGVINIITKGYDSEAESNAGVKVGSFGTKNIWTNLSTKIDNVRIYFNGQFKTTEGDNRRVVEQDALYAMGLSGISHAPYALDSSLDTTDLHLGFKGEHFYGDIWYLKNKGGNGAGVAQVLSTNDYTETQSFSTKLGYKYIVDDNLEIETFASYQSLKQDSYFVIFPPGMLLPREFDQETGLPTAFTTFTDGVIGQPVLLDDNYNLELITNYNGLKNHRFRGSFGYLRSEMDAQEWKNFGPLAQTFTEDIQDGQLINVTDTPFVFSPNENRNVYYLSLQDEWAFANDWELTTGVRYDKYSDFGSTINPRVALVWQARQNLTVKTLYGEAFRAPSIGELYAINNPVILGNQNLSAEKINTFELALDYRPNFDWRLLFNVFNYRAKSLIIYTPQLDGSNQANNATEQNGTGFEFEANWKLNDLMNIKLGLAIQKSEDKITNHDVADAPQKMADVSINWKLMNNLNLYIETHLIKDRARLITDTRAPIKDYIWTNVNINYIVTSQLDISLAIRNFFNQSAYEPSDGQIPQDFPLEKIGYWLDASYQF